MIWLILTILAVLSRAAYGLSTKVLSNEIVGVGAQTVLFNTLAALLALPFAPLLGGISLSAAAHWWPGILFIVITATLGNFLYFTGQKKLDVGTTQIAFSSIVMWAAPLSALFLGSKFSTIQIVGITLLLTAIILAQYRKNMRRPDVNVLFIIASAAMFAAYQVATAKLSTHLSPATYLVLAYGGTAILSSLIYSRRLSKELRQTAARPIQRITGAVALSSVTSITYLAFSYFAFRHAPDAGVVVLLLTGQVIISVLLGIVFLRERTHVARKLSASVLAVLAAVLIKS